MKRFKVFMIASDSVGVLPVCLFEADDFDLLSDNSEVTVFEMGGEFVGQLSAQTSFYLVYDDQDGYENISTMINKNYGHYPK